MSTIDHAALLASARAILPDVVAVRRRLHRIPEIGNDLPRTQALVADELRALGVEHTLGTSVTSVTGIIRGGHPGPVVLLRGDMDALALTEDTGLDFVSETPGRMHACGHDTHVAMLLGAARLLHERRADLAGTVILMFQPGEENYHGARFMLEEGVLEAAGERPAGAFALHISTSYPAGELHYRAGALLAANDRFVITVKGRGGHGSAPHRALDPVAIAAEIVIALQLMVTRRVDVFDPAVVNVSRITAGTAYNIIPEVAVLEGTTRAISYEQQANIRRQLRQVVDGVCAAHGATADVLLEPGYPVTMCDPDFTELARQEAVAIVGDAAVKPMRDPIMGAEDFSYVLQEVPGAMFFLGARPASEDPETAPSNHSNKVVFEEEPMAAGVATYVAVALRALEEGAA
ncbi:MAG: M20 family metallopeptidase [Chloroflexota bacterium]